MNKVETQNLINALKKGVVTVVFKKINSEEIRIMPCTINETLLEENGVKVGIKEISAESDHIAAWAIDKEAWRSFRLETVISWEEGLPSGAKDGKVA
jgi:hypothetical protein